jgi:hypothetical protein
MTGRPRMAPLRRVGGLPLGRWRSARRFRIINHELHGANPPPASAENLQEDFSSRLNRAFDQWSRRRHRPAPSTGRNRRWLGSAAGCRGRPSSAPERRLDGSPHRANSPASVALFREPRHRPVGLLDSLRWDRRLRPRVAGGGTLVAHRVASLRIPYLINTQNISLRQ